MNAWKIEAAFRLGKAGISPNAWPLIVKAANALQRSNEADCSICPDAWVQAFEKRARAALKRLRAFLKTAHGLNDSAAMTQPDPRGCPLTVAGVGVAGEGFSAEWFKRAEKAAYAEREAVK